MVSTLAPQMTNFWNFHTAKAHPSFIRSYTATCCFLHLPSHNRQISGPCFCTSGRDISPSAPKPCVGVLFCSGLFISGLPWAVLPGWDRLVAERANKPYHLFLSSALQLTVYPLVDFYQEWRHCSMLMERMFEQSFSERRVFDNASGYRVHMCMNAQLGLSIQCPDLT